MATFDKMREHGDIIRKAFDAGKKTCVIEGRKFRIVKRSRVWKKRLGPVNTPADQYDATGSQSWLTARPTSGGLTPVYSVETKPGSLGVVTKAQR